ncbi:MAG TPA: prolyl oligopeptidase family serine peptidase [Gemmatimonadales bacterium]|nr:prolyl oligopeptidase family serine peptidase [Gemmatimonadales bacterium]
MLLLAVVSSLALQSPQYPVTRRDTTATDYFGTRVPTPYAWMEDQNAADVAAWVDSQNAVTFRYLDGVTLRGSFKDRLTTLWNYTRVSVPDRPMRGGALFFSRNSGLQSQSPIYRLSPQSARAQLILDPNTLSPDGSTALSTWSVSPDGRYLAYGLSPGGSDWRELHIRVLATGKDLPDTVRWAKFSGASWTHDGKGFFYSRFPAPPPDQLLTAAPLNQKVYYHVLGTPDSTDNLIYAQPDHPDWYVNGFVTEDGQYLILSYGNATDRNHLAFADLGNPMRPNVTAQVKPLFTAYDASYRVIGNLHNTFYVRTTNGAPKAKIVAVDPADPSPEKWKVVVPEGPDAIEGAVMAGGRIIVQDLADVKSRLRIFSTEGRAIGEVPLPGIGSVGGLSGRNDTPELYYGFSSFLRPATVLRFDLISRKTSSFQPPRVAFNASAYETKQVFYSSKDGTKVPMFVTAKKGIALDGSHPTVLYAYGGFDINITPAFSPVVAVWLEHGGVYAVPNLRGGGEYGEAWHHAGMLEKKQNVFDDFIAAAEYLIKSGYTSSAHLAIHGYSNGGLLVGAVEDQRPELFAAAYPGAGVMDMLRYQEFTAGKGWVSEYGSSNDSAQFHYLIKYSPVQNVKAGTCYPATIITTADHDDRVVPSHSYKFAAALQAAQSCDKPTLIRVDTKTSHGYMPTDKRIAELSDIWAFTGWNTGMR